MFSHENFDDDLFADDKLDLTPIIDVLFLLLIFFIMTTTFTKPVLNVVLPKAESAEEARQRKELLIVVDAKGAIFNEGRQLEEEDIEYLMQSKEKLPINFQVDKAAPFSAFIKVLDLARLHDRTDFVFTIESGKNEKNGKNGGKTD